MVFQILQWTQKSVSECQIPPWQLQIVKEIEEKDAISQYSLKSIESCDDFSAEGNSIQKPEYGCPYFNVWS